MKPGTWGREGKSVAENSKYKMSKKKKCKCVPMGGRGGPWRLKIRSIEHRRRNDEIGYLEVGRGVGG
jgi:hypothetical protein